MTLDYNTLPVVADISRWQGNIDWDKFNDALYKNKPISAVFIRSGVSWGYTDAWFARNWAEAKRILKPRSAYHVIYPEQDATRQMDSMFKVIGDDLGELPQTLDCELDHGLGYIEIAATIEKCVNIIRSRTGRRPILYSRAQWINDYIIGPSKVPPAWLLELSLFLAQYLSSGEDHPGPVSIPHGCSASKAVLHQVTKSANGLLLGYESNAADISRVLNQPLFNAMIQWDTSTEPQPQPDCGNCVKLQSARTCIQDVMNTCEKYMLGESE